MTEDYQDGGMIHATTQFWEEPTASVKWQYAHGRKCATPGCKTMITSRAKWCSICSKAQPEHIKAVQEGTRVYQAVKRLLRLARDGLYHEIACQPRKGTQWNEDKLEEWIQEVENGNRDDSV